MKLQNYKTKTAKGRVNVSAFYHHDYKLKVIVPTMICNYLVEKVEEQPPFKGFKLDIAMYYLSLIISVPATHKDKIYKYGYIPLNATSLRQKNYLYKQYFDYFEEIQLLESMNYSTTSHTCNRYRYNYKAIKSEGNECIDFSTFEVTDKKLNNKIVEQNLCNDSFSSCPHLCKWFNNGLSIDFAGVNHKFQSEFCYNKYQLTYRKTNPIMTKAYNYWYSALTLHEKCFRATRNPETDNRLHTNITNMPSAFRPFITYEEENIVSLDIKNSQPYFMILLLERFNDIRIKGIMSKIYGSIGSMLQKLEETTSGWAFQEEFSPLKEAVLGGSFYEYLGQFFDIKPVKIIIDKENPDKKTEIYEMKFYNSDLKRSVLETFVGKRNLMKKLTLQILYTPLTKPSKEYLVFKEHFPQLCSCIELFKTHTDEKDSYKMFPKLLQHIESDCVLNVITPEIAKQYPEMPIWTIHDSFCTTITWYYILKDIVKKTFYTYSGGVMPQLKAEYWCEEKDCSNSA
ncbi:hypothetical protein ACH34E_06985 [Elizabethkingia anophelis]|uniref:hypothetical protein n=1 Tax=Elizabethkingia anophelis TaxID=1117645 RepID=UPI00293C7666|nr:hypothetical protein [Elizabethkingia anophelis]MCT4218037.1 hypothetical protein [Elizabethkingia anophelis]MDV3797098.1 hypothetical protein [Elizabethkingia anophelis]